MKIIKVIFLCLLSICVFENKASAAWEPGTNTCYISASCLYDNNTNYAMLFYIDGANEGGYYYFPPHIQDEFLFYNHLNEPQITYRFYSIQTSIDDNKKYLCYIDTDRQKGKNCDQFYKDQFKSNVKDCNGMQDEVNVPRNFFKRGDLDNLPGATTIRVKTSYGTFNVNNCYLASNILPDAFNGNPTAIPAPVYETVPIGGDPTPEVCSVQQTFKNHTSYDQIIYFNNDKNKYFYVPADGELSVTFNNYREDEVPGFQRSIFMKVKNKNDNNGYLCELYDEHKPGIALEVEQVVSGGTQCEGEKSITANDDTKTYNDDLEGLLNTIDESKFKVINISEYDGDDYTYDGYGADFSCFLPSYLINKETNFTTNEEVYSDPCYYQTKLKYINTTSYDQVIYFDDSKYFYIPANGSTVISFKNYSESQIPNFQRYVFMKTKDVSDNAGFLCKLQSKQAKDIKYPFAVLDSVSTRLCDNTSQTITSTTGQRSGNIDEVLSTTNASEYRSIFVIDYKSKLYNDDFDCYASKYVIGKSITTYGEGSSTSKSDLSNMSNEQYVYSISKNSALSGSQLYINIPRYILDTIKNKNNVVAKLYIIDENKNVSKKEVYILNTQKASFEKYEDKNVSDLGNGVIRYNQIKLENYAQDNIAVLIKQKGNETNKIRAVLYISDSENKDYYLNLSKSLTSNGTLPVPANGYVNLSNNENKIAWADYKVFDKEGNVVGMGSRKLNPYDNITISLNDLLKKHPEYYDYLITFYTKNANVHASVYYEGSENQGVSPLNLRSAQSNILTSDKIRNSNLEANNVYKEKVAGSKVLVPHKDIIKDDKNATIEELIVVNKGYDSEVVVESENSNGATQMASFNDSYDNYLYFYAMSKDDFLPNAANGAKVISVSVDEQNLINAIYKACVKDFSHVGKSICFYDYGVKDNQYF